MPKTTPDPGSFTPPPAAFRMTESGSIQDDRRNIGMGEMKKG